MPTINQLIRKPRRAPIARNKVPAMQESPQKRGVCTRVYTTTPGEHSQSQNSLTRETRHLMTLIGAQPSRETQELCAHMSNRRGP